MMILWLCLALSAGLAHAAEATPETLLRNGHWKRLRALVEPRVAANPKDAQALYLLSKVREAYEQWDAARDLAEKAAALEPTRADYRLQVGSIYGQTAERASVFKQFGLARRFKSDAEAAATLDPKNTDARWQLIEFHLRAPGIVGGDKKKVDTLLDEIARVDPCRAYKVKATSVEKDPAAREALYLKAVEANGDDYEARLLLAIHYASDAVKKYDLAEKQARAAIKIDPDRVSAYGLVAALCAQQQRWPELDAVLAEAEANVSDNLRPYYEAGRTLLRAGTELPRAERAFKKYLSQEPEAQSPPLAAAHWRLGQVYEKSERKKEAIAEWEEALRLRPDFEPAKKDLKRLR
jgi:tetratricopeptide (TPR) repeat protein